ncbi:molybdate ABC transporter substrate-binding protein [Paenibacillus lutrae]|uniref:Molybdate ABC transporter substrate-binding protein n=1 Tax=Paenibacillus lutrae TaxID=2078573 RepID=A0A7X3FIE6_9BACL|nr:molybdate ABC transporter substrate-binding protein [Paenibacillus lutrae]MVP00253.1 molybdate ABC transporter substrate-binding protein [Paenibacillus lutrae]
MTVLRAMRSLVWVLLLILGACSNANSAAEDQSASGSGGQSPAAKVELIVSAAASLRESMEEIGAIYMNQHSHINIFFNFASTGSLQKQIEQGAPADIFLAAGTSQMEALIDKKYIDPSHSKVLLTNELVLITSRTGAAELNLPEDLTNPAVTRIAIGDPKTVPAGSYAQRVMSGAGLWESVQDKLVLAKDVRQVLAYVETGNADAGFVYKTDALYSDKVRLIELKGPAAKDIKIEYPAGIVANSSHREEAATFYSFLLGKEAEAVYVKNGFTLPDE